MKKTILYLLLALFISCSPLDKKCGEDLETVVTDLKILVESGEITNEEFRILSDKIFSYEDLSKIAGKKTYREILKKAKLVGLLKKQKEESELKEMHEILDVSLSKTNNTQINSAGSGTISYIYHLAINNKSKNDISGLKGTLIIKDLLDTEIKILKIQIEEQIKNSTTTNIEYRVLDREKVDNDFSKLKTEWIPKKIILSDEISMKKGNIDILDITLSKKHFIEGNKWNWEWSFEFKNNSQRTISAFKGNMLIKDLFDEEMGSFDFNINDQIEPSSMIEKIFSSGRWGDEQKQKKLKNRNIENLKIEWNIEKLVFLDEIQ